jgi:hypothetical protein
MSNKIAVRLYSNEKYGKTYGKGLYRRAVFNGTADLKDTNTKYLLDFFAYNDWENTAKTDLDMEALTNAREFFDGDTTNKVFSWVVRWGGNGDKTKVIGFGAHDLRTNKLLLCIEDEASEIVEGWELTARSCRTTDKSSPQLLATNYEL